MGNKGGEERKRGQCSGVMLAGLPIIQVPDKKRSRSCPGEKESRSNWVLVGWKFGAKLAELVASGVIK
jgi:hypothetical protein